MTKKDRVYKGFYLDKIQVQLIRKWAYTRRVSESQVVREFLNDYLQDIKNK